MKTAVRGADTILQETFSNGVDVVKCLFDMCIDYYTNKEYSQNARKAASRFAELVVKYGM